MRVSQVQSIVRLVDELLDIAGITRENVPLKKEPVALFSIEPGPVVCVASPVETAC